jgi:hypothetical protein
MKIKRKKIKAEPEAQLASDSFSREIRQPYMN